MTLPTLTELTTPHGFAAGDINTDGYVAVIPAYQKVYFADSRVVNSKGFHKLDMINTKLTGVASAAFIKGEVVTQATSGATGIYDENPDRTLTGTITDGPFLKGELVTQATSLAKGFVVADSTGSTLYVYPIFGVFDETHTVTTVRGASETTMATPDVTPGLFHLIYRTTSTEFTATGDDVTGADSGSIISTVSAVTAPPHWLPWADTFHVDMTDSLLPEGGSNAGCLYMGRIVLNDLTHPNQWFMARQGDPLDWLTQQDDVGSPVSSQSAKQAGVVGDALIVPIAYQDHYLILGCASSMYAIRGDPARGGGMSLLTDTTGIFCPTSWCWDDDNNLYFFGTDGIYKLTYGSLTSATPPTNLTSTRTPSLVRDLNLNRRTDKVTMAYDKQRHGILITAVQLDGEWSYSFFFDLRTQGIFPEVYADDCIPASMLYYDSINPNRRGLLFGGQDGFIRKFDETVKADYDVDDAAVAIDSHVVLGPMVLASGIQNQVLLNEMALVMSDTTDTVRYDLYGDVSAESLCQTILNGTPSRVYGTAGPGRSHSIRKRVRGTAIAIKLSNAVVSEGFEFEKAELSFLPTGNV